MISDFEKITGESISHKSSLGGGCIGDSNKVTTENGNLYFVKHYSKFGVAKAEALGLKELEKAKAVKVPHVIGYTNNTLVLNHIESNGQIQDFQKKLGIQFATLHKYTGKNHGFIEDNFIGDSDQKNNFSENWTQFFTDNRLSFQVNLAKRNGYADSQLINKFNQLKLLIPDILEGSEEPPALLHGDLWGGNVMSDENGEPCLIDPAVYYGHREADLAMTKLFGGFNKDFYNSYNETYQLKKGYQNRENLYKLYHILNHLNLFGRSYYSQTISLMDYYI